MRNNFGNQSKLRQQFKTGVRLLTDIIGFE